MIVVDATEVRRGSRLPKIETAVLSPILEEITGADIMVSVSRFPASSETLIQRHVSQGAILIQRKSACDLINSIVDESINRSIARMIACGAYKQYQRVLMSTGFFAPTGDGVMALGTLTGHASTSSRHPRLKWSRCEPEIQYKAFATIRRRIGMRGATFLPLVSDDEIPSELLSLESDLGLLGRNPTKELLHLDAYPSDPPLSSDPLQIPIEVKDGRKVLAAFKGVGPKKTQAIYDAVFEWNQCNRPLDSGFLEIDWEPSLLQLLTWASMSRERWKACGLPKVSGWGSGMRGMVREQLGLEKDQDLWIDTMALENESALGNEAALEDENDS